ncbi:putative late L1 protein [Eptesicus serotinus papillomavirus 2]|uniref:Major capsid protein L1 n=1 Tax=Eptesicus serotinus papillomavirus 2 TaxID=1464072 RepID=W8EC60_9PAPI|nr:putative late L1 protein [Eptesicus serotinus papillomavirus 2]AHJ81395.1 putative late L1 protein [Eptesicus serotinus papillomavirus 2]
MAFWLPSSNKLYLPPTPVARVLNTEEYIQRTSVFYHASSDRLLTVGHPYFSIVDSNDPTKVLVPKVTGNQYRVFRVKLPDPNQFAIPDDKLYDPTKERLVFGLRGVQVDRGLPLGVGLSGHPFFNKLEDVENPNKYLQQQGKDNRQNTAFDVKQSQMLLVGCAPPLGEHWAVAKACADARQGRGDCPPLELKNTTIEDGDMADIGFGAADFTKINDSKSEVPLDIADSVCKYPDYLRMTKDTYGDQLFFYARREQMYARHFFDRGGVEGEAPPQDLFLVAATDQNQNKRGTSVYFGTPSGSLVSTDSQLFNRPYWVERAQGQNNGICWQNELFITVLDNTRGTNITISQKTADNGINAYESTNYKVYLRHTEEFELSLILQLCKVPLDPEVLAHINTMNPAILEGWNLGVNPPQSSTLEDHYRYIQSLATRCPDQNPPQERPDPYAGLTFWTVDLTEKLSLDLDQFGLGRRFLYQTGLQRASRKRALVTPSKTVKRRRK